MAAYTYYDPGSGTTVTGNKTPGGSKQGAYNSNGGGFVKASTLKADEDPTYYYSGGSTGSDNYYNDLWAAFQKQSADARDAAIKAIMKNLEAVKGSYEGQIVDVGNDYDRQIDENELRKERARRVIRENQANRGQLESGLGRQELLSQNLGYDKTTSNLKSARTKAITDIQNLIAQAEAEAESNIANVNSNYANTMLQYKLSNA